MQEDQYKAKYRCRRKSLTVLTKIYYMAANPHSTLPSGLLPLGCKLRPGVCPLGWRLAVPKRRVGMHILTRSLLPSFWAAAVGSRL